MRCATGKHQGSLKALFLPFVLQIFVLIGSTLPQVLLCMARELSFEYIWNLRIQGSASCDIRAVSLTHVLTMSRDVIRTVVTALHLCCALMLPIVLCWLK